MTRRTEINFLKFRKKYEVIIIMKRNFERMKEKEGRISNIKF